MSLHMNSQPLGNLKVQVAKTQWLLSLELHQFHNLYNAEVISSEEFCCCDIEPTPYYYYFFPYDYFDYFCNEEAEYFLGCNPLC